MEPLADAVRRIEERDLDFEVASSRVREIDDVLAAMDGMRASLKDSLEAQWRGEQAQREQIAALAHDLKTPLTVVRGNVDLLLEGELSGEQRACAADVAEGARQMGTYVSALIDASLGVGASFAPKEARLRPLLERLRAQVEALAAASGVRVAWSEGADLPAMMLLDEALVERAVANVAANAVEHAPAGSSVAVDVRADVAAGCLALSVADEGPGFSSEALRRGCERFYQGDAARAARGHSGLGLHVAAETAARHGIGQPQRRRGRRRAGDVAVAAGPCDAAGAGRADGLRGVEPVLVEAVPRLDGLLGLPCGQRVGLERRKTIEFGRGRAFREGRPRSVGKAPFYEQALWRRGFFGAPQVGPQASEFDSFSPSRALPDARVRRRSVSRRARPSVHGFLRNAASFLCVPSAFFRLRTFPQVAFVVSLRASSALAKTQHFVRNRARAGRADSSDRAPRSEGGDKARRRVFRTRSVDARPGKSTDARLRQPIAFPIL